MYGTLKITVSILEKLCRCTWNRQLVNELLSFLSAEPFKCMKIFVIFVFFGFQWDGPLKEVTGSTTFSLTGIAFFFYHKSWCYLILRCYLMAPLFSLTLSRNKYHCTCLYDSLFVFLSQRTSFILLTVLVQETSQCSFHERQIPKLWTFLSYTLSHLRDLGSLEHC